MKKTTTFFFIFLLPAIAVSQKTLPGFGQIELAELQLKSCSFEPDANAMKLFDIQEAEFEPSPFGGKIVTQKRVRIKIFNEKGYPFATVKIPYFSKKRNTKITDLRGIVCSPGEHGEVITQKIEEADFFKEKAITNIGLLSFTFPNLKPGSVIEYSYTITEKNRLQFDTWLIQADIPTAYTSNSLIIPTFSVFKEVVFGVDSASKKTELLTKGLDKNKTTFYKENIPAFIPEPLMSSRKDNMLRMNYMFFPEGNFIVKDFSPASMWRMAANLILKSSFFDELYRKQLPGTEKIVDTALTILDKEQRINYLFHAVKRRIPERMEQTSFPEDIADAWKSRSGSTAEINMILMNLLKRSNINCHPILVSTRENGKINTDFPSFGQFDGMDILVNDNGLTYLIDASIKFQPYNIPPMDVLNRQGFVLNPDNIQWVTISDDRPLLKQTTDIFATLTKEGKMEAGASLTYYDYAKAVALDSSHNTTENKNEKFFDKQLPGLKVLTDQKENMDSDDPLFRRIEFDYDLPHSDNFYFVNPQLFITKKTNPFTADKRTTDIDMGSNQEIRVAMQLNIPPEFQVEDIPKNMFVRSPDSSFSFTRIISVSQSIISFSQVIEIKKAVFDKKDYAGLFDFFSQVQRLSSEEIILKKVQ